MKILPVICLILIFVFEVSAQPVSGWTNHSDKSNTADLVISGNYLWAATGGGAFGWNLTDSSFITLQKTEGLQSILLTTAAADNYGKIWFGSSDGIISVYDPAVNSLKTILDIYLSQRPAKRINDLKVLGDTILVSTDFGISLIDSRSYVFYDTYFRFGDFTSYTKVYSTLKKDLFYVATQSGAAIQKQNSTNLSAPESWNVYTESEGLPDNIVRGIVSYRDTIICATEKGLAFFNGTGWSSFLPQFSNAVTDLYVASEAEEQLLFTHNNVIYKYGNGSVAELFSSIYVQNRIKYFDDKGYYAATSGGAAALNTFNGSNFIFPNGPRTNQFRELAVGTDGVLWVATGSDPAGVGANSYDQTLWQNYSVAQFPDMTQNAVYSINVSPGNIKNFGNWGRGVTIYDGTEFRNYNSTNSELRGISIDPAYIVITSLKNDSRGNLWVLNYGSVEKKSLSMLTPDEQWYHFLIPAENNLYLDQHFQMAIDSYDTKWYAVASAVRKGLFYFNENKTYDNPSDDKSGFITTDQGLTNSSVTSIAVDRRGDIWVGTSLGLTIISNSGSVLGTPQLRYYTVYLLRQQSINCILVDPLNNKWIGTNQGLLYVNSDGSALLAAYDSKNSPLLADQIKSLTMDPNTGEVFAGSDDGLVSFKTSAIHPVETFNGLNIYPNPLRLNSGNGMVTIDGLIRDSDIKILTVSGKLVNEFSSPGGRIAFWDGRDLDGNPVNSGVYIIVAYDKEGNNVATAKVAVLKD